MGLDFHIEHKPTISMRKNDGEWETYHDELWPVTSELEDLEYVEEPLHLEIKVQPAPALPPNVDSYESPHIGYGGFGRVREQLANLIGVNLHMMWGFQPYAMTIAKMRGVLPYSPCDDIGYEQWEEQQNKWWHDNAVQWETIKHPLVPFLDHSDSEGIMTPEECAQVSPLLRELAPKLDNEYDTKFIIELADYMALCVKVERNLVFC